MNLVSSLQPYPSRNVIAILITVAVAYTAASLFAELEFPVWEDTAYSTLQLSVWLAAFAIMIITIIRLSASDAVGRISQWQMLAIITVASISVQQSDDLFVDIENIWTFVSPRGVDYFVNALLAVMIVSTLFVSTKLPKKYLWVARCLQATVVFQLLTVFSKLTETGHLFGSFHEVQQLSTLTDVLADFSGFLCIEFYIVGLVLVCGHSLERSTASIIPFVQTNAVIGGQHVGANARQIYRDFNLYRGPKHPPFALAFYPVFREITFFLVMFWLVVTAGMAIKRAKDKSIILQFKEMTSLWFNHGIDPPSYYAQELYEVSRQHDAPHYLTRYETKNGLLSTLNNRLPKPFKVNEMSHKALFASCCAKYGIPHPQLLLTVDGDHIDWNCELPELATDLFCKRQRGMGAVGTLTFRFQLTNSYCDQDGYFHDLDGVLAILKKASRESPLLVQPWLQNHPSISDLALDSLITIRVVTCKDERGEPEVTQAMLRLLAKLEPQWKSLPDEEYAAPINLISGKMGLFTGDNFRTSHLRYERHPITNAPINGRVLHQWNEIKTVAIAAHNAFPHRLLIGWDIALTEKGPVVLEGNSNLDVMFLQRVHDEPTGRSRLGELLNFHLRDLYNEKMGFKAD
jgi:Sugar-transfer associated ATP-grasp